MRGYGKKVYSASTGGGGAPKPHPWLKNSTPTSANSKQKTKVPSAHVYDKGYKKWEQSDADNYDNDEEATTVVEEVQMRRPKTIV